MSGQRCGYTIVDRDGDEQPCDLPAGQWRWYQDCGHEDLLDVACEHHANKAGEIIATANERAEQLQIELRVTEEDLDEQVIECEAYKIKLAAVEKLRNELAKDPDLIVRNFSSLLDAALDPDGSVVQPRAGQSHGR